MNLEEAIINSSEYGLFEVAGPFIIVFTLTYAMLNKTKLFERKNIEIAISLVLGALFVVPHITGQGPDLVPVLNALAPYFALTLIVVMVFTLLLGIMSIKIDADFFVNLVAILIVIEIILPDTLILAYLARNLGINLPPWLDFLQSDTFFMAVVAITFIGVLMFFVGKDEE